MNKTIKIGKLEFTGWKNITLFVSAIVYWIVVATQHLNVTDILTDWVVTPFGKFVPRDYSILVGIIVSTLILILIVYQFVKGSRRVITSIYWLGLFASLLLAFRFLITAPIEIIHFPQYALLSFLIAKAVDPERKKSWIVSLLFWVTFMGILDETNQYFYLTRQYTKYYDFNDFMLNEIGAAVGLMLYYGFKEMQTQEFKFSVIVKSLGFKIVSVIFIVYLSLSLSGILHISPHNKIPSATFTSDNGLLQIYLSRVPGLLGSWQERDLGGYIYTLTPFNGILLMLVFGFLFSFYRYSIKNPLQLFRKKK